MIALNDSTDVCIVMDIFIKRDLIGEMLDFAKEKHPNESLLLIRGNIKHESIRITDYQFPPYTSTDSFSASYPLYMLPIDFSVMGTAHSHPNGVLELSVQDITDFYGRVSLLMAYPYGFENVACFNKSGKRLNLSIED